MLPERIDRQSVDRICAILNDFDVGGRMQHIREFIWRGGTLALRVDRGHAGVDVSYALAADWPAAVLEREPSPGVDGLFAWQQPVLEGRWVRSSRGYELRVGIDLAVPSAMYIRSQRLLSHVPFVSRSREQVEEALNVELAAYVDAFLSNHQPVPRAAAEDAERLRALGLAPLSPTGHPW